MYFSSNALARKIEKLAQDSWKPVDLPPSHAYLLMLVIDQPGIQPLALAGQLLLSPSTITRLVEKLETKKLVVRRQDGKSIHLHPTAKAHALKQKLQQCLHHFYHTYSGILGKEESARLVGNMNRITDKLPG